VGALADDAEMQTAVIYSDRQCTDPGTVTLNRHVPSIDVADLLLGIAGLQCLQVHFNPLTLQARFTSLRDVMAGAPAGQRPRVGTWLSSTANTTNGFLLK
jgi:hypothetical protein